MIVKIISFSLLSLLLVSCSQYGNEKKTVSQPAKHKGQVLVPLPPNLDQLEFLDWPRNSLRLNFHKR